MSPIQETHEGSRPSFHRTSSISTIYLIVYLELTYEFQLVWNCECDNYGYVSKCMGIFMFFVWLLEGEFFGIVLCIYGLVCVL